MNNDVKSQSRVSIFPTCLLSVVFYFMAFMGVCFETLPDDAFAIMGGPPQVPEGSTLHITIPIVAFFLLVAVVLHVFFYKRDPERFDVPMFRKITLGMFVVMASLFGLSAVLSRTTGLPAETLTPAFDTFMNSVGRVIWIPAVVAFLLLIAYYALPMARLYLFTQFGSGNRMARKVAAKDFAGAIRIGEARPQHKRDILTTYNLAAAYVQIGELEKARDLYASLTQIVELPKWVSRETFDKMFERLREIIDEKHAQGTTEK